MKWFEENPSRWNDPHGYSSIIVSTDQSVPVEYWYTCIKHGRFGCTDSGLAALHFAQCHAGCVEVMR